MSVREEEEAKIICEEINPLVKNKTQKLYIKISNGLGHEVVQAVWALLKFFNGLTPVYAYFEDEGNTKIASKDMWVSLNESLLGELKSLLGNDCVRLVVN